MGAYGSEASFGIVEQSSFGVVASGFVGIPILSETLAHDIEEAREGDFTRYGWQEPPIQEGKNGISGGIEFEPYPEVFGWLAKGFFNVVSGQLEDTSSFRYDFFAGGSRPDWDSNVALPPYTVYAFRGVGSGMLYADCQITELGLSQEPGGFLKGSVNLIGRETVIEDPHTITWEDTKPWLWDQASVSWDGAGIGTLESFELAMANKVEGVDTLNLSKYWGQAKRTDFFEATLNGTINFDDFGEYLKFAANSYIPVLITYEGDLIDTARHSLIIDVPQFRYTTFPPQVGGAGRVQVSFTGRAVVDTTSNYSVQLTLINSGANGPDQYGT